MILHKLTLSPFSQVNLIHVLSRVTADDGILLMQDAIYALKSPAIVQQLFARTSKVYGLEPDCIARGIQCVNQDIELIDYAGFVALTLEFDNLVSW